MITLERINDFINENTESLPTLTKKQKFWQKFWIQLPIITLATIAICLCFPVIYEENDDILMLLFASGGYTGRPEVHLVFINFIYGYLTQFLYSNFPGIEWYTILFILIQIVSTSIIIWRITNQAINKAIKIAFVLLFIFLYLYALTNLQFTVVAGQCAAAGMSLIISNKNSHKILGLLLFALSSLIRFDAACLVAIIFLPTLANMLLTEKAAVKKNVVILVLLFTLPILFKVADNKYYKKDSDWGQYLEYNYYRGKINDNPNTGIIKKLPDNLPLSDYILLQQFFPDPSAMSNEKIENLYYEIKESPKLRNYCSNILINFKVYSLYFTVVITYTIICLRRCDKWLQKLLVILTTLAFFTALTYVSLNSYLKMRVFITAFSALFVTFAFIEKKLQISSKSILSTVCIALLSVLVVYSINRRIRSSKLAARFEIAQKDEKILDINKKTWDYTIMLGGSLHPHYNSPFNITNFYKGHPFIGSGWLTNIPYNKGKFNSYLDFVDKNAILVEESMLNQYSENIIKSIKSHYHIDVALEIIRKYKDLALIRFVTSDSKEAAMAKNTDKDK